MKKILKRAARRILRTELRQASARHHEVRGLILHVNKQMISASQHKEIEKAMNRLQEILSISSDELLGISSDDLLDE